jgi:tetratricopeptide (TPR) repeat protein
MGIASSNEVRLALRAICEGYYFTGSACATMEHNAELFLRGERLLTLVNPSTQAAISSLEKAANERAVVALLMSAALHARNLKALLASRAVSETNSDERTLHALGKSVLVGVGLATDDDSIAFLSQLTLFVHLWGTGHLRDAVNPFPCAIQLPPLHPKPTAVPCHADAFHFSALKLFDWTLGVVLVADVRTYIGSDKNGLSHRFLVSDVAGEERYVQFHYPVDARLKRQSDEGSSATIRLRDPYAFISTDGALVIGVYAPSNVHWTFHGVDPATACSTAKAAGDYHLANDAPSLALVEYAAILQPSSFSSTTAQTNPNVVCFANAAQCALNTGKFEVALFCSAAALLFDPAHEKSFQRYTQAEARLRQKSGASFADLPLVLLSQHGWPRLRLGAVDSVDSPSTEETSTQLCEAARPLFMRRDYDGAFNLYMKALRRTKDGIAAVLSNTAVALLQCRLWNGCCLAALVAPLLDPQPSAFSDQLQDQFVVKNLKRAIVALRSMGFPAVAHALYAFSAIDPASDPVFVRALHTDATCEHSLRQGAMLGDWISPAVEVRDTDSVRGRGVFAREAISAGTIIMSVAASACARIDRTQRSPVYCEGRPLPYSTAAIFHSLLTRCGHPFAGQLRAHVESLQGESKEQQEIFHDSASFERDPFLISPRSCSAFDPTRLFQTILPNAFESLGSTTMEAGVYVWCAMLNHGMMANAYRRFIADYMIIVAAVNIECGEEIVHRYFPLITIQERSTTANLHLPPWATTSIREELAQHPELAVLADLQQHAERKYDDAAEEATAAPSLLAEFETVAGAFCKHRTIPDLSFLARSAGLLQKLASDDRKQSGVLADLVAVCFGALSNATIAQVASFV